ncbi:c-type cytochrome [Hymenobacter sp. B1770]|uniref:c-type cytochrome n=1 Tax=Hymenobacter sp. B1770 TaxID=1718788 RepID=UPI003CF667A7
MKRILVLLSAAGLGLAACSTARRSEPIAARTAAINSERLVRGQAVFMQNCQKCHPGGEAGAGPPLNNVHLPGAALRFRVRDRAFLLWLGMMPAFKKDRISAQELDDLVAYLKVLRRAEPDRALTAGPVRD